MAITMQGSWTVRVTSKNASFGQRFVITGADVGNGTYDGLVGTAVFASGAQWSINVQHQPPSEPWRDSAQRITFPTVSGGLVRFNIDSNDTGPDADYDDLVLSCSMPASASDYVVYGTVKTYAGLCLFNPCRDDYIVIDPPYTALNLCARFPELCGPLTRLYPERIRVRPRPIPDPPPEVTPLVIPTGAPSLRSGVVFQSRAGGMPMAGAPRAEAKGAKKGGENASLERFEADAVERLQTSARVVTFNGAPAKAGADLLTAADFKAVAHIRDALIRFRCDVQLAPGLLLRFQEYDRTASEKLGGPYTGTGPRDDLSLAVTDEQGNYIFRFSQTLIDIAAETSDVASSEVLATQLRPDVIVQVLGTGMTMTYETAPYYNIANLQRIDLCVPYDRAHPSRACAGDRVIQRVGDIIVLHSALGGHPNTLDSQGRITSRNANAPQVDCAGWRGGLRVYGCFGKPQAVHYAIYYKRPAEGQWRPVNQSHVLNHIPDFAPGYTGTPVGPTLRSVTPTVPLVGGPQPVPTYDNHEGDLNWIENDLKVILDSGIYRPWDQPGSVQFHIEAYDTAGNMVAATGDTITFYIHNRTGIAGRPNNSKGDITSITMGTTTLGDCGLFELTDPRVALTVRYRAVDPEGFLHSWTLSVKRGNNVDVPVSVASGVGTANASGVVRKGYDPMAPCNFTGTRDEPTADADDYVLTGLQPAGTSNWLPTGHNFCAFAFTLEVYDRVTDGRTANPRVVFWQDLIGLSTGP